MFSSLSAQLDQATAAHLSGDYSRAIEIYETLLEEHPDKRSLCWHLGLMRLLQGQESEAQFTWMIVMSEADDADIEPWSRELAELLEAEANRQAKCDNPAIAWMIRRHLQEVEPDNIDNVLHTIQLSVALERLTNDELNELEIVERMQAIAPESATPDRFPDTRLNFELLLETLQAIPYEQYGFPAMLQWAEAIATWIHHCDTSRRNALVELLLSKAISISHLLNNIPAALPYVELCLQIDDANLNTLRHLSDYYLKLNRYSDAIAVAEKSYATADHVLERLRGSSIVLKALMTAGGKWERAFQAFETNQTLLQEFADTYDKIHPPALGSAFLGLSFFFFPYFGDRPQSHRSLQNRIARIYQDATQAFVRPGLDPNQRDRADSSIFHLHTATAKPKLKVGYVSRFLRKHSVGWLCRWLFKHHDPKQVEVFLYFVQQAQVGEFTRTWFVPYAASASCFTGDYLGIAEAIHGDQIDVLIDLDSLTADCTNAIFALKPAPVQATWLGLDATGIPAIDYFIADPYVLPEHAQAYYTETIWRLPQTYLAVDGFEIGVPSLRRDTLNIPADAVIYFSAQSSFKRNPDHVRSQLRVLHGVPNSYFLLKGIGDGDAIQNMVMTIAEEEGVNPDRLRFLPRDPDELTHRANMQIADVVLDTFPYNGATTTMETLWLGIPIVTQVGEQFAARNSYTMMVNAGISEGIAWSADEYVEWGIRLGNDAKLRQDISARLGRSRQTSPLWKAEQFTREMETAYQAMWRQHIS